MYGTKVTAGFTLYPGKAYLEISAQLYNRTPEPQTFLWWANPAVAVNDIRNRYSRRTYSRIRPWQAGRIPVSDRDGHLL